MRTFTLYGLKRPDERIIRYWGITCLTLEERLNGHRKRNSSNPHKDRWIDKMRKEGLRPEIVSFVTGLTFEEACGFEIEVIKYLRSAGHNLLNISSGGGSVMLGRTPLFTKEHKRNISLAKRGKSRSLFTEEHKMRISQSLMGNHRAAGKGKRQNEN